MLRFDHPVDIGKRARQRLLADDLLSGGECRQCLLHVQAGRRADIDDIEVGHAQHLVERSGTPGHCEFIADVCEAVRI